MDVIQEYNNIKQKPQGFLCNISLINDKLEFQFFYKKKKKKKTKNTTKTKKKTT